MYQFTTTTIVNTNLDSNGTTAKYAGTADLFKVTRVGTFLKDNIVSVYKRPYYAGVKEIAKVTVPTITAGLVARIELDVRLSNQTQSDYASTYMYFKKPIIVEVLATGTAATDATAIKNEINKLKDRFGIADITASTSGADIIVTATNFNQRFFDIKILKEAGYTDNSIITPQYTDVTASTFSVTTNGRLGFGDTAWMSEKIKLDTYENVRKFGISTEERPVIGGAYTQFTLRYSITKDGTDGIVAGGTSVTTHVFYVLDSLVAAFEAAINAVTGVTVATVSGGNVVTITGDASIANDAVETYVANGSVAPNVWSVVSGTSATVTDAAAGEITAHATIDGDTVIKVIDSEGTTATFTITVA